MAELTFHREVEFEYGAPLLKYREAFQPLHDGLTD